MTPFRADFLIAAMRGREKYDEAITVKKVICRNRLSFEARVFLTAVIALAMLGATLCYADTRDADLLKQGTDALKQGRNDIAVARFSDAIVLSPGDADAWRMRSEAYFAKRDDRHALADCVQAAKLAPNSSEAYRWCGTIYFAMKNFNRALQEYDDAVRLDPRNAFAYADRGDAYYHLDQIDRAISDYDQALRIDPSESETYSLRGDAWFAKGDFDRAWNNYNRAIQVDPKNVRGFMHRGLAAAQLYAYDDAIADFDEAIRIDPTYRAAYRYRAKAEGKKSAASRGKIYLSLSGLGIVAVLFAAVWVYCSPTAVSHNVERHFERIDGQLVFYPGIGGSGYIVPDAERENTLRVFVRRSIAAILAIPVVAIGLMFGLGVLISPLASWLHRVTGISMGTIIPVSSFAAAAVVLCGLRIGILRWRRAATNGLTKSEQKGKHQGSQKLFDLVMEMPGAVRWVLLALVIFIFFVSLDGLWQMRNEVSLASIENMSLLGWLRMATTLAGPWLFGWYLVSFAQRWHRFNKPAV